MARRRVDDPDVLQVPQVPWETLRSHLVASWKPGHHVTLIGPAGAGKSHAAIELGELCQNTMVIATKRHDPLITALNGRGYVVVSDIREVPLSDQGQPMHKRVLLWSNPQVQNERERRLIQQQTVARAMQTAERQRKWCLVLDETMWLAKNLRLETEMEALWFQARSSGVSVVACAQRPSHIPLLALSQATYLFLWRVSDRRDIERLREISGGIPLRVVEENVQNLDWQAHECLFVDTREGHVAKVVFPAGPRKRGAKQ
jgi:hypothetical protein